MHKLIRLAPLLAISLSAPGTAQISQSQNTTLQSSRPSGNNVQTTPVLRAKIPSIKRTVRNDDILQTIQSKKDFVANSLNVDPDTIGLSEAVILSPAEGEFTIPGQVRLVARNIDYLDFGAGRGSRFEIEQDGNIEVLITPSANLANSLILVSLTMRSRPGFKSKVMVTHVVNGARQEIESTLSQRPDTINFIHSIGRVVAPILIKGVPQSTAAYSTWQLDSLEITPINR